MPGRVRAGRTTSVTTSAPQAHHDRTAGRTKRHGDRWCALGVPFAAVVHRRDCGFCHQPLPAELGPAARYCSRAHRQRAYEARQDDATEELRRQIRGLQRQLAGYERVLERIAADPACEQVVLAVLREEVTAGYARLVELGRSQGGPLNRDHLDQTLKNDN